MATNCCPWWTPSPTCPAPGGTSPPSPRSCMRIGPTTRSRTGKNSASGRSSRRSPHGARQRPGSLPMGGRAHRSLAAYLPSAPLANRPRWGGPQSLGGPRLGPHLYVVPLTRSFFPSALRLLFAAPESAAGTGEGGDSDGAQAGAAGLPDAEVGRIAGEGRGGRLGSRAAHAGGGG